MYIGKHFKEINIYINACIYIYYKPFSYNSPFNETGNFRWINSDKVFTEALHMQIKAFCHPISRFYHAFIHFDHF